MLDMESKQPPQNHFYTHHPYIASSTMSNPTNNGTSTKTTTASTSMSTTHTSSSTTNTSQSSNIGDLLLPTPPTPFYYSTSLPNNINETSKTDYFSIIKPKLSISTTGSMSSSLSPTHVLTQEQLQLNSPPLDYNSSSSSNSGSPINVQEEEEEEAEDEDLALDDQSIYSDSILLSKKFFKQSHSIPAFQLPIEPRQIISPVEEEDDEECREHALSVKQSKPNTTSTSFTTTTPRVNHKPFKFLIIDDNLINIKILEKILHRLYPNATIKKLQDSTKAISFLNTHSFDMLFLDIEMPEVSGIEIASRLRKTHHHYHHQHHHHLSAKDFTKMGIIAVTTRNLSMDLQLYSELGIDHTFSKPLGYDYDYFSSKIDEIIESRNN